MSNGSDLRWSFRFLAQGRIGGSYLNSSSIGDVEYSRGRCVSTARCRMRTAVQSWCCWRYYRSKKVSVNLPDEDAEFLDAYAQVEGFPSRAAVLHKAARLLRGTKLDAAYEEAFQGWEEIGEAVNWELATYDGFGPYSTW